MFSTSPLDWGLLLLYFVFLAAVWLAPPARRSSALDYLVAGRRVTLPAFVATLVLLPPAEWTFFSHALIWHGRRVCKALRPQCPACGLRKDCPWPSRMVDGKLLASAAAALVR